ncbi:MAG: hypothetical protein KY440_04765 [Actinobacteria bacterium]|nr:hypothetical protein [Actinomycetota bacterium]
MTVFLVLGTIGLVVLLAGILAGEVFDGALDGLLPGDLGPGLSAALGAALAAFGFGAALAVRSSEMPTGVAGGLGAVGAVAVGAASYFASRALIGAESSPARSTDLFGVFGTVVSAIPAGGLGEVAITYGGTRRKLAARADQPLPSRTPVYVLEVLSETAVMVAPTAPVLPTNLEGTS